MDTLQIVLLIIVLVFVIVTFSLVLARYLNNSCSKDTFTHTQPRPNTIEKFGTLQPNTTSTAQFQLINLCYNLWPALLQAGSYGSQVFLPSIDTKYLPYNYKLNVTGNADDYLQKKNLIETPNIDVIYNSIVIDFRAMKNEKIDKITIKLDMTDEVLNSRYYIIQFCDINGYDVIPLTPGGTNADGDEVMGAIKTSTAISSKSNAPTGGAPSGSGSGKATSQKTWSVVSPLYTGPMDEYTCRMNSRQAYVMHRVHVQWDLETGCPGAAPTAQQNKDYDDAVTFLNNIKWIFPSDMKNSNPDTNSPSQIKANLKAFNAYYPNLATNADDDTNADTSFSTYNAQGYQSRLDPRNFNMNNQQWKDLFNAFAWYGANQISNVPLYWDTNLVPFGFYLSNSKLRNKYDTTLSANIPYNYCTISSPTVGSAPAPNSNSNPCTAISDLYFNAFVKATKANLELQTWTTARTTNTHPGSIWSTSASFTGWMDKDPATSPFYYGEKAYIMFDRTWIYIFANIPYDALYFSAAQLSNGDRMYSANEYSLVIGKDDWPTCAVESGWWSLVSYNSDNYYNTVDCKFTTGNPQLSETLSKNSTWNTTKAYNQDVTILMTPHPERYTNSPNLLIMGTPTTPTYFYVCLRVYAPSDYTINNFNPNTINLVSSAPVVSPR
jgi:hypothetical protein